MNYTLEVPDQDDAFVLEVLRRLASVKLTPIGRKPEAEHKTEQLLSSQASRDLLLEAGKQLKQLITPQTPAISVEERARRFEAVAGSWQSEENGDELNQQLRAARYFRDRAIEL